MRAFPKAESELFFGFVPWVLFAVALISALLSRPVAADTGNRLRFRMLRRFLAALILIQSVGIVAIVFTGGFVSSVAGIPVRATNSLRLIVVIAAASAMLLAISPSARRRLVTALESPLTLAAIFTIVAVWLSLGPIPETRGRLLAGLGLYSLLYDYVPGFGGLRVPARYAMIAAVFLSVCAGFGAFALITRARAALVAPLLSVAFLAEAWFAPMPVNLTWGSSYLEAPSRVFPRADAPAVYDTLARIPHAVVAELPFGDTTWELRYVYYSTVHWKPLVNGYSGGFPASYKLRVALLQRLREDPEAAWRALRDVGTTHVVVHERAFPPGEAAHVVQWLRDHAAVEIARFDGDLLFDVSGVWPPR
jgi:hypothetical protein